MHHQELEIARAAVRRFLMARWPEGTLPGTSETVLLRESRVVGHQFICALPRNMSEPSTARLVQIQWFAGNTVLRIREPGQESYSWDWRSPPSIQRAA